ncbi:paraquat-inducible protein A [Maricaulaceae bacterium MS644]
MAITDPASSAANIPVRQAPARNGSAGGGLARAILIVSVLFLGLGLWLPVMETRQLWLFKTEYSLLQTVQALFEEGELGLAALVFAFSIITPLLKSAGLAVLHLRGRASGVTGLARFVEAIGRWSLTDVLVVAILIVVWSSAGALGAASLPGLWFFAASAIGLMIAAELIVCDLR